MSKKGPAEPQDEEKLLLKYTILKNELDSNQYHGVLEQKHTELKKLLQKNRDLQKNWNFDKGREFDEITRVEAENVNYETRITTFKKEIDDLKKDQELTNQHHYEDVSKQKQDNAEKKRELLTKLIVIEKKNEVKVYFSNPNRSCPSLTAKRTC
jgi:hypothetical protein